MGIEVSISCGIGVDGALDIGFKVGIIPYVGISVGEALLVGTKVGLIIVGGDVEEEVARRDDGVEL